MATIDPWLETSSFSGDFVREEASVVAVPFSWGVPPLGTAEATTEADPLLPTFCTSQTKFRSGASLVPVIG